MISIYDKITTLAGLVKAGNHRIFNGNPEHQK